MPKRIISKKYLTENEVREWLGLTSDQLDRLRLNGGLPYVRITRTVRKYPVKEIEAWLRNRVVVLEPRKIKRKKYQKRRIRRLNNFSKWDDSSKKILRRDSFKCQMCGNGESLSIHHIIPRAEGGSDHPRNLITLCKNCHDNADVEEIRSWEKLKVVK